MSKLKIPRMSEKVRKKLREQLDPESLDHQTAEVRRLAEFWVGAAGFEAFCQDYVYIQDKFTKAEVKMDLFEGQRIVLPHLVGGIWLCLLKGRQLGITWLIAAFVCWKVTFANMLNVVVVCQDIQYAEDFIVKVKYIRERLPAWMQKPLTTDRLQMLRFNKGGHSVEVRAVASGKKAGRSITGDIVIIDEADFCDNLEDTMQALIGGMADSGGQLVLLTTSGGPGGVFHGVWEANYGEYGELINPETGVGPGGFMPIFLHYSMRRGRDQKWYDEQHAKLTKANPIGMKQEHPENPQEAFEFAAGRVYAGFEREIHIGTIELPTTAELYRAIDWGQTDSPFACLWLAHIRGEPGLLVSPDCPNTIAEMFKYRFDPDKPDQVLKEDDHTCDALRYAVVTYELTGFVYVYRELYLPDPAGRRETIGTIAKRIHNMSGWESAAADEASKFSPTVMGEEYLGTVADRSWPLIINTMNELEIWAEPHKLPFVVQQEGRTKRKIRAKGKGEIIEGVERVRLLIDGTVALEKAIKITREQLALATLRKMRTEPERSAHSLEDRRLAFFARRLLAARGRTPAR